MHTKSIRFACSKLENSEGCDRSKLLIEETRSITRMNMYGFVVDAIGDERLVVSIRTLSVHQDAIGHSEILPVVEGLSEILHRGIAWLGRRCIDGAGDWVETTCLVVLVVPVSNEEGDVTMGLVEGHRDHVAVIDDEASVAARGSLEADGGEVEEAADLVLHLELVSPVPT